MYPVTKTTLVNYGTTKTTLNPNNITRRPLLLNTADSHEEGSQTTAIHPKISAAITTGLDQTITVQEARELNIPQDLKQNLIKHINNGVKVWIAKDNRVPNGFMIVRDATSSEKAGAYCVCCGAVVCGVVIVALFIMAAFAGENNHSQSDFSCGPMVCFCCADPIPARTSSDDCCSPNPKILYIAQGVSTYNNPPLAPNSQEKMNP